jgi:hypothetical protein
MRWTSWRDCGERSIGPDGSRLTSERITSAPGLALQLFWNRRDAGERVASIVEPHIAHLGAARPCRWGCGSGCSRRSRRPGLDRGGLGDPARCEQ